MKSRRRVRTPSVGSGSRNQGTELPVNRLDGFVHQVLRDQLKPEGMLVDNELLPGHLGRREVAGHGDPGTLADVHAQRTQLESQFQRTMECFEQGMSYDAALQAFANDAIPLDFQRLIILASYWEFTGKRPESTDPASQNHMTILQGIATEAKLLLGRKGRK